MTYNSGTLLPPQQEFSPAPIGHNSKPTKDELELAFRLRTRQQRITDNVPFDIRWQWEVWLSDLPSSAMLVAFAIRIYANNTGADSSPSLDSLAIMTKLSRRCVQDSLKLIEKTLVRKTAGAGRAPNRYALIIPDSTLHEIATVIDMRSRAPRAPQSPGSEATNASLADSVAGQPLPHKPVVGQMDERSRATSAPDLTRDQTRREEPPREGAFGKVAAAVAATMATALPLAAAQHPVEQVRQVPAECWQTAKGQMEASLNIQEARAQKQIWVTPTGGLEITGDFRAEMERMFPLVDMASALAAACVNVRVDSGAWNAMQAVRRQFGFMQQDAIAKQKRAESYGKKPSRALTEKPANMPQKIWDDIQAGKAKRC